MDPLSRILNLPDAERVARGLVNTPREIFQQTETWGRTYERVSRLRPELESFLTRAGLRNEANNRPPVFLIGAGTSDYIGRTLAPLLRRMWQSDVCAVASTDLLTSADELTSPGKPYLWVSFSRSGDSSEGVAVLQSALASHPEIHHLIVCCNREGRMVRTAGAGDNVFRIILEDEVNDRGLAMTSSFSNMVVAGHCLAHLQNIETYHATLGKLITAGARFLSDSAELTYQLVEDGFSKVCFLGTGELHGVAMESALKVLELTAGKIIGFSESFLGVRHGPLSAIDNDTIVIGFVSGNGRRRSYEVDLLEEIREKKLAKRIVVIAPTCDDEVRKKLEKMGDLLTLELSVADCYRPPIDVFIGQLLGLFSSIRLGFKPDTPSPLGAISRVVSQVRIY